MKKLVAILLASLMLVGLVGLSADAAKAVKKVVKKTVVVTPVVVPTPVPAPTPMPTPVKPVVVKPKAAPAPGLALGTRVGLLAGIPAGIIELTVPDNFLAPMLGLSGVSYRIGGFLANGQYVDYPTTGANGTANIAGVNLDGVIDIPKDWMGGLDTYAVGGVNYIVSADNDGTGGYGVNAGLGIRSALSGIGLGDLPGMVCLELGYGALKVNMPEPARGAVKGLNALVGYSLGF